MSDNRPDTDEILHSLNLLRSTDAEARKQGIEILSGLADDPRVLQVFEYLYQIDPDPEVRDMAWQAILWRGPSVPAPGPEVSTLGKTKTGKNEGNHRLFLMNPSNNKLVANQSRRAAQNRGRIPAALAIILLFVAGIFWGLVIPGWLEWYKFRQEGVTTQGEVLGLEARSGDRYIAYYRFATGEIEEETFYSGEQPVSREFYNSLAEDTPIDVIYLPDDPNQSRLDDDQSPADQQRYRFTYAAAGCLVVIGLLLTLRTIQRRPNKHIIRGQVVSSTGHKDTDGDFNIKLRYRFQSPGGRTVVDQTSHIRNDLDKSSLPRPGTPIVVYYQNEQTYRLL